MAVWSVVPFSRFADADRLDAEYFQPVYEDLATRIETLSHPVEELGDLVTSGYRVVYENTTILDEPFDPTKHVRFLQSANIPNWSPSIDTESMGWVSRSDWERYPKGRIKPGELLIEVKGKAEKVVQVPDDFDVEALATGTLFKLSLNTSRVEPAYVLAYLLSDVGRRLRDRLKSNIMVPYINKDGLYGIPIVLPPRSVQEVVADSCRQSSALRDQAKQRYADAEALLADALGLAGLTLPTPKTYTAMFSDAAAAERLDAGYFHPEKRAMLAHLGRDGAQPLSAYVRSVRKMVTPSKCDPDAAVRNFDLPDALRFHLSDDVPATTFGELGSTKKAMRPGDVAVSRLRFYLKEVAVVRTASGLPVVGSSEFYVLRPVAGAGLRAEAVVVLLRSEAVQSILKWCQNGSAHPRFDERDLLSIPVPPALLDVQDEIADLLSQSIELERESARQLAEATARVEALVLAA